jgi:hypothetical protein
MAKVDALPGSPSSARRRVRTVSTARRLDHRNLPAGLSLVPPRRSTGRYARERVEHG